MKAEAFGKDLREDVNASAHELSERGKENAKLGGRGRRPGIHPALAGIAGVTPGVGLTWTAARPA